MTTRRADWDAAVYHRVSAPQFAWGQEVLQRLVLRGDECVLDAGCGTGRLTALLPERLPRGRVVAMDRSRDMTRRARQHLPRTVAVVQADLLALPFRAAFDVVFSTATFHWVLEPEWLYAGLLPMLVPGGRLHAQCGGAGNLARLHARVHAQMHSARFAARFADWRETWRFLSPDEATAHLSAGGFTQVHASLRQAPTPFDSRQAYAEFVEVVVVADYLSRLPEPSDRAAFMEALLDAAAADDPAYTLDYVRLDLTAVRPGGTS